MLWCGLTRDERLFCVEEAGTLGALGECERKGCGWERGRRREGANTAPRPALPVLLLSWSWSSLLMCDSHNAQLRS